MLARGHAAVAYPPERLAAIDVLRGCAMVWMAVYHFAFDLNNFGFLRQDFYRDPVWTLQRTMILGLFLFCAGFGQVLARHSGQDWRRFWRRWIWVVAGAVLVSAGSWLMFPRSFIYFGVLHGMAVMLVIARLTAGWGLWCLLPAALALIAPFLAGTWLANHPLANVFNGPALNWLGLITHKPVTEDYVPLLPWMGVVWIGVAAAHTWLALGATASASRRSPSGMVAGLGWLGRHSLAFYLAHQPILIGGLTLFKSIRAW